VELVITLTLSLTLLLGILIIGILTHKTILLAAFLPGGTPLGLIFLIFPLELLSYVIRTLSLGLR
jgi:F-type H+-transporting ATPase subunit a